MAVIKLILTHVCSPSQIDILSQPIWDYAHQVSKVDGYFTTPPKRPHLIAVPFIPVRSRGAEELALAEGGGQRVRRRKELRHVLAPEMHPDQPWSQCEH